MDGLWTIVGYAFVKYILCIFGRFRSLSFRFLLFSITFMNIAFPCRLLFLVFLATAGCSKQTAEPEAEPLLLGRWVYLQRQDTHYHPNGTIDWTGALYQPSPGAVIMNVTPDSMITRRDVGSGFFTYVREGYTRRGNVIEITEKDGSGGIYRHDIVLDELTAQRLLYHEDQAYPSGSGGGVEFRTNVAFTR